jgi:membrane protein
VAALRVEVHERLIDCIVVVLPLPAGPTRTSRRSADTPARTSQLPDSPLPDSDHLKGDRPVSKVVVVKRGLDSLRRLVEGVRRWVEQTFLWRIWERMLENEFVDRSVALGAKGFVSFFPFIIVAAAFVTPRVRASIFSTLVARFGLEGDNITIAKQALASSSDIRRATGVFGLILLVFYATSFTTALERVFVKAWRRPAASTTGSYVRGPVWLGGLVAFAALLGGLRHFLAGGAATVAFAVLSAAASSGLWWATSWLMLNRQVRWRALLPTGLALGLGLSLYAASASIWMPPTVDTDQHQFGLFGVSLALISWFTGAGMIILVATCAGASLADEPGRLGHLARGGPTALTPEAGQSLPPPARTLTVGDALGILPSVATQTKPESGP